MHILGHNMAMARALEESEMDTSRERERQTETETEMETKTTAHEAACERWPRPVQLIRTHPRRGLEWTTSILIWLRKKP